MLFQALAGSEFRRRLFPIGVYDSKRNVPRAARKYFSGVKLNWVEEASYISNVYAALAGPIDRS